MISRSFCWAIMKKMTKKWDLETSNAEMELKIGIYAKNWVKQVRLKIFYYGQSQRSTDDVCWRGSVTSPRAYMAGREAQQACGAHEARGWAWDWHVRFVADTDGTWRRVAARAREEETSAGVWRRMWCSFWPFLVGFCSGLAVLSFYAFFLAVEWAERWYSRVAGIVDVMAVARFWQWLLDEGEGSGRISEMSIGTRKSEEWLWYRVNNIKWERKTE